MRKLRSFFFGHKTETPSEMVSASVGNVNQLIEPINLASYTINTIQKNPMKDEDPINIETLTDTKLSGLPVEIWFVIIATLDVPSVIVLMQTCKTFYNLIHSNKQTTPEKLKILKELENAKNEIKTSRFIYKTLEQTSRESSKNINSCLVSLPQPTLARIPPTFQTEQPHNDFILHDYIHHPLLKDLLSQSLFNNYKQPRDILGPEQPGNGHDGFILVNYNRT